MHYKILPAFIFTLCFASAAHAACTYDQAALLALDFNAFDQDMNGGWRAVEKRSTPDDPSCREAAADLLALYREQHRKDLSADDNEGLAWHEGQLRAALGDYKAAIPLIGYRLKSEFPENRLYAEATVAFLERDKAKLLDARARLASLPKPEGFDESAKKFEEKYGRRLSWPENLDTIDGFINCFDKPYFQAYEYACRPKTP